jgi:hypothetical protein
VLASKEAPLAGVAALTETGIAVVGLQGVGLATLK